MVVDGSTDGTAERLQRMAANILPWVLVLPQNQGKGAAVLHGLTAARAAGFYPRADDGQPTASTRPT